MHYDVIIIGGSYAGLSAALSLGRAMRKVLLIDSGEPCNRFSTVSHNFLSRDGIDPAELLATARKQVLAYPGVRFAADTVLKAERAGDGFSLECASGSIHAAAKLLFATGLKDILPQVKGLDACWGRTALHCPYCDGYEFRDKRLGILGNGNEAFELAMFLKHWSRDLVVFTNGKSTIPAPDLDFLVTLNIPVIEEQIAELAHERGLLDHVLLKDGTRSKADAIYLKPATEQQCNLPEQLGCRFTDDGHVYIENDMSTCVEGVFAAGDCVSALRSVAQAVASGNKAGMMIDKALTADRLSEISKTAES